MTDDLSIRALLPDSLLWLADAPMFIDADFLARFYDAIVKPQAKEGLKCPPSSRQK